MISLNNKRLVNEHQIAYTSEKGSHATQYFNGILSSFRMSFVCECVSVCVGL